MSKYIKYTVHILLIVVSLFCIYQSVKIYNLKEENDSLSAQIEEKNKWMSNEDIAAKTAECTFFGLGWTAYGYSNGPTILIQCSKLE